MHNKFFPNRNLGGKIFKMNVSFINFNPWGTNRNQFYTEWEKLDEFIDVGFYQKWFKFLRNLPKKCNPKNETLAPAAVRLRCLQHA